MSAGEVAAVAAVLAEHAACTLNDFDLAPETNAAAITGVDVWSCGIVRPFADSLDDAECAHDAAALLASDALAGLLAEAWDEGFKRADFLVHRGQPNPCAALDRGNPYREATP